MSDMHSSSENILNDNAVGKPMSIKDRIRAMNLVAERTNAKQMGSSTSIRMKASDVAVSDGKVNSGFEGNGFDASALRKKQKQELDTDANSTLEEGSEEKSAADAITMWRRRRVEEKKIETGTDQSEFEDDAGGLKVEQWTISDLTKSNRQGHASAPLHRADNSKHASSLKQNVEQTEQIMEHSTNRVNSTMASIEKINNSQKTLRGIGPTSPKKPSKSHVSIMQQKDFGFVMPKLKPVRRAPHTLALVTAMTSPQRIGSDSMIGELGNGTIEKSSTIAHAKKQIYPPKYSPTRKDNPLSPSHRTANIFPNKDTDHLKTVENNYERSAFGNSSTNMHLDTVGRKFVHSPPKSDFGPPKKKTDTPKRSKISERIKAFSSAANGGTAWKQNSPARHPIAPRTILHGTAKRVSNKIFPQQVEESSCTSSERQSNDDDSISVSTPLANGTPARLGAHPPTPNSYSSEVAYTSIASSGDGAVAGSTEGSQQSKSYQMQYSNVSTPGSSVHEDSIVVSPPKHTSNVAKPALKITLQSKLEYDKQKAVRRSRIIRRQMKVPSALVAAQKKAQEDQDQKPVWGAKSPETDSTPSRESPNTPIENSATSTSLDLDPTMMDSDNDNVDQVKPESETVANKTSEVTDEKLLSKSQTKSVGNQSMKANVMKQLIKRRRRRKEYHAGKRDNSKEKNSEKDSATVQKRTESTQDSPSEKSVSRARANPLKPRTNEIDPMPPSLSGTSSSTASFKDEESKLAENYKVIENSLATESSLLTTNNTKVDDIDQVPPLPPEIIRSTSPPKDAQSRLAGTNEVVDISFAPESSNGIPEEGTAAVPSDSISVASSVLFDEYPDEDDEPEPVVDVDDEPEPDVDCFVDMDLSPIKSNDVSKHVFDTSTSYRGSPESSNKHLVRTPTHSPPSRPHIRDLIVSNSTPKRANRHASLRNVGEMLYSPKGTPLESSVIMGTLSPVRRAGSDISEEPFDHHGKALLAFREKSHVKDSVSLFRNHCSDAFSDVSSGFRSVSTASGASSPHSTISSRANRLLSERRSRSSKKSPEPEHNIDRSRATDLARKIMSVRPTTEQKSSNENSPTPPKQDRASANQHSTNSKEIDYTVDELMGRAYGEEDDHFDQNNLKETETSGEAAASKSNEAPMRSVDDQIETSAEISDAGTKDITRLNHSSDVDTTHTSTTGELHDISGASDTNTDASSNLHLSNLYGSKICDSVDTDTSLVRSAKCKYPALGDEKEIGGTTSWMSEGSCLCLGTLHESSDLDVSMVSAVRISQQESEEDVPFDEEIMAGAIEVEYIPNENIALASSENAELGHILMHINSNVSMDSKENAPNYISASSCDTTDDSFLFDLHPPNIVEGKCQ